MSKINFPKQAHGPCTQQHNTFPNHNVCAENYDLNIKNKISFFTQFKGIIFIQKKMNVKMLARTT